MPGSWTLMVLLLLPALAGCSGNYVFDDGDYRPLGDPQAHERGR